MSGKVTHVKHSCAWLAIYVNSLDPHHVEHVCTTLQVQCRAVGPAAVMRLLWRKSLLVRTDFTGPGCMLLVIDAETPSDPKEKPTTERIGARNRLCFEPPNINHHHRVTNRNR
jgi:hypothetical protein